METVRACLSLGPVTDARDDDLPALVDALAVLGADLADRAMREREQGRASLIRQPVPRRPVPRRPRPYPSVSFKCNNGKQALKPAGLPVS